MIQNVTVGVYTQLAPPSPIPYHSGRSPGHFDTQLPPLLTMCLNVYLSTWYMEAKGIYEEDYSNY
jgi:hypothetical protein